MATSLLQIDDHNPLVFYSPNNSWTRGGNVADFDNTSTLTSTTGASATLTFTGTGISVWGTIQLLSPNTSTYVLSSYSIDGGPTTIYNATEKVAFQFQQKLFQSATLNDSVPHTIVVTLVNNNATFFIDYFLVIPSGGSTSVTSSLAGSMTVSGADSSETARAGDRSHWSNRVPLGPAVGGTLGGLASLVIAILAIWLCCKRRKDKNQKKDSQATQLSPVPFITPASQPLPMQQYQPYEGSDRVSEYQSYSQHPSTNPPTSASGVIPPSSKAAQLSIPSPRGDSLHSRPLSDSLQPPGYAE